MVLQEVLSTSGSPGKHWFKVLLLPELHRMCPSEQVDFVRPDLQPLSHTVEATRGCR